MVEVTASYQITERTKERDTVYIALPRIQERWTYLLVKRLFDSFFALIGLIVLAIPMAIIALLIVLDSPGGAIFKQERLGKNGKPFLIYKFRTMHHDAEVNGPKWADILQFDEFFLLPIYAVIGIAYSTHSTENT